MKCGCVCFDIHSWRGVQGGLKELSFLRILHKIPGSGDDREGEIADMEQVIVLIQVKVK